MAGSIESTDLKNGIAMLQTALWSAYRDARVEHHEDLSYTTHVTCKRCGESWDGDSLSRPERHAKWCPLAWSPKISDPSAIEQRARAATDFLYEYGWQKIINDRNLSEDLFTRLYSLLTLLKE